MTENTEKVEYVVQRDRGCGQWYDYDKYSNYCDAALVEACLACDDEGVRVMERRTKLVPSPANSTCSKP